MHGTTNTNKGVDTMASFHAVRAFQNNGPDYWLIYAGTRTFGADPIAQCDNFENARLIVDALNALFAAPVA